LSLVNLTVKHGRSLEEARAQLETAVSEVGARFGSLVRRVDWARDRNSVKLFGTGFEAEIRVDAVEVHLTADVPILGQFLAGPFVSGLKSIVQKTFQKRLT
jgi:hypothetical protein